MADTNQDAEVEQVLSAIRRLIVEGPPGGRAAPAPLGRLVLTPALRVDPAAPPSLSPLILHNVLPDEPLILRHIPEAPPAVPLVLRQSDLVGGALPLSGPLGHRPGEEPEKASAILPPPPAEGEEPASVFLPDDPSVPTEEPYGRAPVEAGEGELGAEEPAASPAAPGRLDPEEAVTGEALGPDASAGAAPEEEPYVSLASDPAPPAFAEPDWPELRVSVPAPPAPLASQDSDPVALVAAMLGEGWERPILPPTEAPSPDDPLRALVADLVREEVRREMEGLRAHIRREVAEALAGPPRPF